MFVRLCWHRSQFTRKGYLQVQPYPPSVWDSRIPALIIIFRPCLCIMTVLKWLCAWLRLLCPDIPAQLCAELTQPFARQGTEQHGSRHAHPALVSGSGNAPPRPLTAAPEDKFGPFQSMRALIFLLHVFHCKPIVSGMCGVPLIGIHSEASTRRRWEARHSSADAAIHHSHT